MAWPFPWMRRRQRAEREALSAGSVEHLKTLPGTDEVIGTLYTDPLAPPDQDPDAFYETTPEAAPRRIAWPSTPPLPRPEDEAFERLKTALLGAVCPRSQQRTWMALTRCRSVEDLELLLDQWIPTTDGWELSIQWPEPHRVLLRWHDRRGTSRHQELVRGVDW